MGVVSCLGAASEEEELNRIFSLGAVWKEEEFSVVSLLAASEREEFQSIISSLGPASEEEECGFFSLRSIGGRSIERGLLPAQHQRKKSSRVQRSLFSRCIIGRRRVERDLFSRWIIGGRRAELAQTAETYWTDRGPRSHTAIVIGMIEFCLSDLRRADGDCCDELTNDVIMSIISRQLHNEDVSRH